MQQAQEGRRVEQPRYCGKEREADETSQNQS